MKKRLDGRKNDEAREIEAKAGVIKKADGSGYFKIGKTAAYAAVYGPREMHPKFLQNPRKGYLRCNYNMMPFSGAGERVRPGPNRRAKEISMVTENALKPVVNLDAYPNSVVDVFIELPQTDAGSRCAGICAAAIALADAGIQMKDMVTAIAAGLIDNTLIVDPDYFEEHYEQYAVEPLSSEDVADMACAMVPSTGEVTLLQMDGIIPSEKVMEALELLKPAMKKISEVQQEALRQKYKE